MRFALAILAAAVLASAPVARAHSLGDVLQLNLVRARSLGYSLLDVRQTGNPNLPPQCQSTCNPVLSAINSVRYIRPTIDLNVTDPNPNAELPTQSMLHRFL